MHVHRTSGADELISGGGNPEQAVRMEMTMPLVGYCDPLIVRSGEAVRCMVSSYVGDYFADVVRLVHGDPNPAGPGLKIVPIGGTCEGPLPGKTQLLEAGSYVLVPNESS